MCISPLTPSISNHNPLSNPHLQQLCSINPPVCRHLGGSYSRRSAAPPMSASFATHHVQIWSDSGEAPCASRGPPSHRVQGRGNWRRKPAGSAVWSTGPHLTDPSLSAAAFQKLPLSSLVMPWILINKIKQNTRCFLKTHCAPSPRRKLAQYNKAGF